MNEDCYLRCVATATAAAAAAAEVAAGSMRSGG